jgi:signal transduction histidine kinase/GAF domain-containing protein/ActR/RegA family two-component response regulator
MARGSHVDGFDAAQLGVLAKIAQGAPLAASLEAIVHLIEGQAAHSMLCSILVMEADDAGKRLRHGAAPSLPAPYVRALDGQPIGPSAGSCGTAAFRGEAVVVEAIATHPLWDDYRGLALESGLEACWSTPIFSPDREVLGTFAMYYRERRAPSEEEIGWVAAATKLATLAILRHRSEQSLRASEARARKLARLYAVSSRVSEALVRLRDPQELYDAACRIAVEEGFALMAWVGFYTSERDLLVPVARFGNDSGYVDAIRLGLRDHEMDRGPAARAIRSGTVAVSNDIANDPAFFWKDEATLRGFRSCAVFPLKRGESKGAFAIYGATTDFFGDEEVRVLTALCANISFAVASAESERERRRLVYLLNERIKELSLVHGFSRVLQAERPIDASLLADLVSLVPAGWRFPEACEARIRWGELSAQTPGWRDGPLGLSEEIGPVAGVRGSIEVVYVDPPECDDELMFPEERDLLTSLGDMLTSHIARVAAETKLHQNAALLRIAGRAAHLGAWTVDLPDRSVTWSEEVCAILEVPTGTSPSFDEALSFFVGESASVMRASMEACIADGTPFDHELEIVTARGRPSYVRAIGSAERSATGAVCRLQGAIQDVGSRRRLEDDLRQAQKMEAIGRLAGGIAHDFNNLLSVILTYASHLVDALDPTDRHRADIEEIRDAGERAARLTRQLLAFSRQQVLRPQVIDLDEVVSGLGKMLARVLGEDILLAVHQSASDTRPTVLADRGQLEQVILNLVVNARDAMPEGGSLSLEIHGDERCSANDDRRCVVIAVSDTGMGMDSAILSRVFEPFFTTKEKGKGTGLGLSTVYGIVAQSGGQVTIESAPGQGTQVRVFLPFCPEEEKGEDPPAAPTERDDERNERSRTTGSETILVVEDEPQVRTLVRSVLARAGYRVLVAESGDAALKAAKEHGPGPIDLLLTDVVMPRMSGRELADRLVAEQPTIRVLYMSGYAEGATVQLGSLSSGAGFLEKPVTPNTLLSAVRRALEAARTRPSTSPPQA